MTLSTSAVAVCCWSDSRSSCDTLVESVARLCEADQAGINQPKEGVLLFAASFGFPQEFIEIAKRTRFVQGRGTVAGRVLLEGRTDTKLVVSAVWSYHPDSLMPLTLLAPADEV
jgi:hypothetical protein